MIKIIIGFIIFSALALFVLMKGGDIDMSGEKHGIDAGHAEPAKPAAPAPAPAAAAPAAAPAAAAPAAAENK
jgi:hypothetical protein